MSRSNEPEPQLGPNTGGVDIMQMLPAGLPETQILPLMGARTLSQMMRVCRAWRDLAVVVDDLWRGHCLALWEGKKCALSPRRWLAGGSSATSSWRPPPCSHRLGGTVNGLQIDHCLECKLEGLPTSPPPMPDLATHPSLLPVDPEPEPAAEPREGVPKGRLSWRASFGASTAASLVEILTDQELCALSWRINLPSEMLAMLLAQDVLDDDHNGDFIACFNPPMTSAQLAAHQLAAERRGPSAEYSDYPRRSQQYTDSIFFTHQRPATWRLEGDLAGQELVIPEAGEGTVMRVSRGKDWGWVLSHPSFPGLTITSEGVTHE